MTDIFNLRPRAEERVARKPGIDPLLQTSLRLANQLQTTLEVEELVELFARESVAAVDHNGVAYQNEQAGVEYTTAHEGRHRCSYDLKLHDEALGTITLYRRKRFSKQDMAALESLLTTLLYPLRNALLYKQALNAALRDPLTGAHNRAALEQSLKREIELAHRHDTPLSIITLDIDWFKKINDTYGHAAGDSALQCLTATIEHCMRGTDMLFRYGGEEFVILLSNTAQSGAQLLAERIRLAVEASQCQVGEDSIEFTVSLGVAWLNDEDDAQTLFAKADAALYRAKADGRNCMRT